MHRDQQRYGNLRQLFVSYTNRLTGAVKHLLQQITLTTRTQLQLPTVPVDQLAVTETVAVGVAVSDVSVADGSDATVSVSETTIVAIEEGGGGKKEWPRQKSDSDDFDVPPLFHVTDVAQEAASEINAVTAFSLAPPLSPPPPLTFSSATAAAAAATVAENSVIGPSKLRASALVFTPSTSLAMSLMPDNSTHSGALPEPAELAEPADAEDSIDPMDIAFKQASSHTFSSNGSITRSSRIRGEAREGEGGGEYVREPEFKKVDILVQFVWRNLQPALAKLSSSAESQEESILIGRWMKRATIEAFNDAWPIDKRIDFVKFRDDVWPVLQMLAGSNSSGGSGSSAVFRGGASKAPVVGGFSRSIAGSLDALTVWTQIRCVSVAQRRMQ